MKIEKIEEWVTSKITYGPFMGYTEIFLKDGEWTVVLHYEYPDDMNYEYDGTTHWGRSVLEFETFKDLIKHFK